MSPMDFEVIQEKHYGTVQWTRSLFETAMAEVNSAVRYRVAEAIELTLPGQMTLWPEDEIYQQRIRLRTMPLA